MSTVIGTNSKTIHSHCSPDLEVIFVMCMPFYLSRELTVVIITAAWIPTDANTSKALDHLWDVINKHQRSHPEGVYIVAGDFNHICLKTALAKFVKYVQRSTRGKNILDCVCSNLKHAYRVVLLPQQGMWDNLSVPRMPAHTPVRRKTMTEMKTKKTWPAGVAGLFWTHTM